MLIHIWNEYLDMQANKLNAKYHFHVQHSTNAQNMYASRNKILLEHKSDVLKKNAKHYYAIKQRYKP